MKRRAAAAVMAAAFVGSSVACLPPVNQTAKPTPPRLVWSEEFSQPLSLSSDRVPRVWQSRGADDGGSRNAGFLAYGADAWNVSPIQSPELNPFRVKDGVLTITARRNQGSTLTDATWMTGMLATDPRRRTFTYGYFEWRLRVPVQSTGMLPGAWLYAAPSARADHDRAEIDVFEQFGDREGMPWMNVLHGNGLRHLGSDLKHDTRVWHTYGVDWQKDWIKFYCDGKLVQTFGADIARWYQGTPMDLRISLGVDLWFISRPATEPQLSMQVDYVRVWDKRS